jgi:hydrogenase nickel incorporation protein HypA/HybF
MHELGMCQDIVAAVEQRAAGRRVTACTVRVGTLHHVVEPAMEQSFSLAAEGTVAESAELNIVVVPVRVRCKSCQVTTTTSEGLLVVCNSCGSTEIELTGGDELVLESIAVEAPAGEEGRVDVSRHTG